MNNEIKNLDNNDTNNNFKKFQKLKVIQKSKLKIINDVSGTLDNSVCKEYLFIDGSYYCFYRYYALVQWWKRAYPDDNLENPIENELFLNKFIKTFKSNLCLIIKKLKLKNPYIIVGRDCKRSNIWRNEFYPNYKSNRIKNDENIGSFFKYIYNNNLFYDAGVNLIVNHNYLEADDCIALCVKYLNKKSLNNNRALNNNDVFNNNSDLNNNNDLNNNGPLNNNGALNNNGDLNNNSDLNNNNIDLNNNGVLNNYKITIITSDKDYLQLKSNNVAIYDLGFRELACQKSSVGDPVKDLMIKILMGDVSDGIKPVFEKCGFKTALKCVENNEFYEFKKMKIKDFEEKYKLNNKLINFDCIPQNYIEEFYKCYCEFL